MLSPTLGIPLAVARFMKHLTTNDHRRILNHPVEPGFDATWAGEGGSWNGDENKECINESHAFLDGNFSREHRKTQLTLSHASVYLPYIPAPIHVSGRNNRFTGNLNSRSPRSSPRNLSALRRLASVTAWTQKRRSHP